MTEPLMLVFHVKNILIRLKIVHIFTTKKKKQMLLQNIVKSFCKINKIEILNIREEE